MPTPMEWRLRELAAKYRIRNQAIADVLGVHAGTVSRWKGSNRMPPLSQDQIEAIARVVGVSEAELLGLTNA